MDTTFIFTVYNVVLAYMHNKGSLIFFNGRYFKALPPPPNSSLMFVGTFFFRRSKNIIFPELPALYPAIDAQIYKIYHWSYIVNIYFLYIWSKMLSSSLYIVLTLTKTTSSQKLFDYDCMTLYT